MLLPQSKAKVVVSVDRYLREKNGERFYEASVKYLAKNTIVKKEYSENFLKNKYPIPLITYFESIWTITHK